MKAKTRGHIIPVALLSVLLTAPSLAAVDHVVGGAMWSIPPSHDLYSAWARNRTFHVGDSLIFRFEMGFYNVVQVSRREFEHCTAKGPYRTLLAAPAVVRLDAEGVRYFVCSVGNYCKLGVRVFVTVEGA